MRIIIKIAKNELRNLFYSPIAWFLTVVMMVLCAFYYTSLSYPVAKYVNLLYKNRPKIKLWAFDSLTQALYTNLNGGFLGNILPHLYLFVPLLTMGIISREFNSGTIRLLYSSPIKLRQIVLGKFLAIAVYNILLVMVAGIFLATGFSVIKSLDYPPLLSSMLGMYLLLSALSAIGFFMSCLSTYQVVSAIASFTFLFILSRIGGLWQEYDFIRDLTYFLSIAGRTEKLLVGLITTKDVLYYLIIIVMFVGFTLLKLKAGQETKPWYIKTGRYLAIIIGALVIGYISARPQFTRYYDTTARKTNTIHPRTQERTIRLNDAPLEVTLYTNLFGRNAGLGFPQARNSYISQFWEQYQRFKPDIDYKYEYYYALPENDSSLFRQFPGKSLQQIAGLKAKMYQVDSALFKSPEEMRKQIDLGPESYPLIMRLKYKERTALLRTYIGDPWPDQQNVNAAFSRLLQDTIPAVYYVTGALERNIYKGGEREYHGHALGKGDRASLINTGFDADSLNLLAQDIPASTSILVLADPKMELNSTVLTKLQNYINKGGNMLVLGEPGKQYVLNPLLSKIGVQLSNGQLVQPNVNETPDKIGTYLTYDGFGLAENTSLLQHKYVWDHGGAEDSLNVRLVGATGLTYLKDSSFIVKPLLLSEPGKTWLKAGKLVTDSTAPVFSPEEGDSQEKSFATLIELSRQINNKEQRIIIASDADLLSNFRLRDETTRPLYSWLTYNKFPAYTPYPRAKDNEVILTPAGASVQKIVFVWVLPALVLVIGAVTLIRRKRK